MKKRVLNLYACLGGNRYKWDEVADIEVTAVELDPHLAELYQERFPKDLVLIEDAHEFLLNNYKDFDFIWSSPPCPTHSKSRFARKETTVPAYPDMKLYQEIIFLKHWFEGKWLVENVTPYYDPLIIPQRRGRHFYWSNFRLPQDLKERKAGFMEGKDEVNNLCRFHEIDLSNYGGEQRKDKIARNLVDYEAGRTIFETALEIARKQDTKQTNLFD